MKTYTIVYDSTGKEIDRIDGNVYVSGSNYPEEALPLRVQVVEVEVINEYRIEK